MCSMDKNSFSNYLTKYSVFKQEINKTFPDLEDDVAELLILEKLYSKKMITHKDYLLHMETAIFIYQNNRDAVASTIGLFTLFIFLLSFIYNL